MTPLPSDPPSTPLVLVIDDTPEILAIIHSLLSPFYQVKSTNSGRKGLLIAGAERQPDLILLDIMMPEMDGYSVCMQLKENPLTRDIPVIFLTAKSEIENEEHGFALGAVDYVTKPIGPSVLLARVKTQIAAYSQRRSWRGCSKM